MNWESRIPTLGGLADLALSKPDQPIVEWVDRSLTSVDADRLSNALSGWLVNSRRVAVGDRVVCALPNGPEFLLAMTAVHRAGAIFVPVKQSRRLQRLRAIVDDCTPSVIIGTAEQSLEDHRYVRVRLDHDEVALIVTPFGDGMGPEVLTYGPSPSSRMQTESSVALICYTSGSTGQPRGVVLSYTNMIAAIESISAYLQMPAPPRILQIVNPGFDYGLYQYLLAINSGGCVCVPENELVVAETINAVDQFGINVLPLVPTLARRLVSQAETDGWTANSVELISSTGSLLDPTTVSGLSSTFPAARIFSMYGQTECKRISFLAPSKLQAKPASVGQAMPNVELRIVDGEGVALGHGESGELMVSGPNVAVGYWNAPDVSVTTFVRDLVDGRVWLRTGDWFHMDLDGDLYFDGRRDDLVKINDERVSVIEVERIARTIMGVEEARVTAQQLDGAYKLTLEYSGAAEMEKVRRELLSLLSSSASLPSEIVRVDSFELSVNGKIVRQSGVRGGDFDG